MVLTGGRAPPRFTRTNTLLPYKSLCRSARLPAGVELQLAEVGRQDVRRRQCPYRHEPGHARAHEEALAFVAHDRVAGPERLRIGGTDAAEGVEDDGAKGRVADVAGQQRIAARQGAARGKAVEDARDLPGIEDLALPVGVAEIGRAHV